MRSRIPLRSIRATLFQTSLPSYIARNRSQLWRLIGQIDLFVVDVTPTPAFGRIVAFDDRVARRVEMRGGVAVR